MNPDDFVIGLIFALYQLLIHKALSQEGRAPTLNEEIYYYPPPIHTHTVSDSCIKCVIGKSLEASKTEESSVHVLNPGDVPLTSNCCFSKAVREPPLEEEGMEGVWRLTSAAAVSPPPIVLSTKSRVNLLWIRVMLCR